MLNFLRSHLGHQDRSDTCDFNDFVKFDKVISVLSFESSLKQIYAIQGRSHGFPESPSALSFDSHLSILAIGTDTGQVFMLVDRIFKAIAYPKFISGMVVKITCGVLNWRPGDQSHGSFSPMVPLLSSRLPMTKPFIVSSMLALEKYACVSCLLTTVMLHNVICLYFALNKTVGFRISGDQLEVQSCGPEQRIKQITCCAMFTAPLQSNSSSHQLLIGISPSSR